MPGSLAILAATFEGEARGRAVGIWTAWAGISTLIGPAGGGLLVELDWRWIFWINLPLIAGHAVAHAARGRREPRPRGLHGIDGVGIVLSALGLAGPVFALIEQPTYGFVDPIVWVPLVVGRRSAFGRLHLVGVARPGADAAPGAVSLAQLQRRQPGDLRASTRA